MEHQFSLNRIPRWAIAAAAVILVFTIGSALHSAGWSQGFTMGLLASNAGEGAVTPYLAYRGGYGFHPFGLIGGFFGIFFRIGFFLLMFALIAKFLGFCRWHRHHYAGDHPGYHGGYGWHKAPGPHRGPYGPWGEQQPQQPPQPEQGGKPPDESSGDLGTHQPQQTGWTQV